MNKVEAMRSRFNKVHVKSWLPAVGQLIVLGIVALCLLLPAPFTPNQLPAGGVGSDLMISSWPTALLLQSSFAQTHQLPLWNPYFGGGLPLAADPLAMFFYPPTYLALFLSLRRYYLLLMLGHLVFAGLGMLLLARRTLGLQRLPALVAAVSFMATPRLLSHLGAGHITIFETVSWFPWLALACWATVQEPRRWGAILGVCIALTLLAGHPQMAYYGLLMTASLAVWLLIKRWQQEGRKAILKPLIGLVAAGAIGVLLAGIQLLPLLELTAQSTRQLTVSSQDSYPLPNFLLALVGQEQPSGIPWEGMVYPGVAVLVLALFAIITRWRKAWPLFLGVVLVTGLTMGNASWFYLIVAHILPELDLFRGLARIWFLGLFLIALLAGIGTESLLDAMRRISIRGTTVVGLLTVFVVALTLIVTDYGYARSGDIRLATTPSTLARTAARLAGSGRVYGVQENIPQVSAVQLQMRLADGWDPLLIESYVAYMQQAGGYITQGYQLHVPSYDDPTVKPDPLLLGLMHVSIVVSKRPLSNPQLVKVVEADGTLIYKNLADAGPGYLVNPGPDGKPPSLNQLQRMNANVRLVTQAPEQETYAFSTTTGGYFVIATPAFPGWIANLDGHSVPIQQIDGVLPAIKVGVGVHTLSYTYTPSSVPIGATISAIALLAVLLWLIIGRRRETS